MCLKNECNLNVLYCKLIQISPLNQSQGVNEHPQKNTSGSIQAATVSWMGMNFKENWVTQLFHVIDTLKLHKEGYFWQK